MSLMLSITDAPELQAIEKSKAEKIRETFEPMSVMLAKFEDAYSEIVSESESGVTETLTKKAKRLRLAIAKIRIETEKVRKEQKEEYLRAGKAIDGVSNILKWAVSDKENKLKEIEDHFAIQEKKRLEELQRVRAEALSAYVEDADERNLSNLAEDEFEALLLMKKAAHEERLAAEKKAEEQRIAKEKAEAEERERIRLENEKLKAEAAKRAAEEKKRIAKEAAERKAREEAERKEREKLEAKLRAEREKAEAERKRREDQERKEREKLEAKIRAEQEKAEAERKAREEAEAELRRKQAEAEAAALKAAEEEEARQQAELAKGDKQKLADLVADLESLKTKYTFKAKKNQAILAKVSAAIDSVLGMIQ